MTKYIEINGTRYDLNGFGQGHLPGGRILARGTIEALGLEIKGDAPKWTIVSNLDPDTPLTHGDYFGHAQKFPTDYATGLELLAKYAINYPPETFELHKDGVVVATLKGENA